MTSDDDRRALVVMAHPDDVDFGSAGLVAQWTAAGTAVTYCLVTDGDAGGFDPDVPRADIAGIRQAEQRAAAAELGVTDLVFLGYPDGLVEVSLGLRKDLARVIRQVRPHRALVHSPERSFDRMPANHPDHLAVGEAALCAVYPDARNPFTFPDLLADEGLAAWTVQETWIQAPSGATTWVDITDQLPRKVAALRAHASQTAHLDVEALLRRWNGANARAAGFAAGRLAEGYRVMDTR